VNLADVRRPRPWQHGGLKAAAGYGGETRPAVSLRDVRLAVGICLGTPDVPVVALECPRPLACGGRGRWGWRARTSYGSSEGAQPLPADGAAVIPTYPAEVSRRPSRHGAREQRLARAWRAPLPSARFRIVPRRRGPTTAPGQRFEPKGLMISLETQAVLRTRSPCEQDHRARPLFICFSAWETRQFTLRRASRRLFRLQRTLALPTGGKKKKKKARHSRY